MKKKLENKIKNRGLAGKINKITFYNYPNTNQNCFDALSEIGIICGVFGATLGLSLILVSSILDTSMRIYNTGFMLVFFSLVLLMNGVGNRYKNAADTKPLMK